MAGTDASSGFPVHTAANGDVVAFLADGTTSSQLLAIDAAGAVTSRLKDGLGNALTSQVSGAQRALDVGINVAGTQIDPRSIRALTSADVVSVVQSTSPWVVQDAADGSVAAGTAGTKSMLGGVIYNSSAITMTTGQQAALQSDVNGYLKVNIAGGTLATGTVDEAAFTAGTSLFSGDGGVFNDSLTVLTSGLQAMQRITGFRAGHVNLRNNAGTEIGTTTTPLVANINAALPAGANTIGSVVLAAGSAAIGSVTVTGTVAVTQSTSPWIVQDAADGAVAPGTAGTKSMLGGVIAASSALTATAGQQYALQGDLAGNLKVNLETAIPAGTNSIGTVVLGAGSAAVGTVVVSAITGALPVGANTIGAVTQASGPWTQNLTQVAGSAIALGQTTMSASLPVTIATNQSNLNVVVATALPAGSNTIGNVNLFQGGTANSNTNPIFVSVTNSTPGTPVAYYNATASIAVNATDITSQYTITTSKILSVKKVFVSSSVRMRADFSISANGSTFVVIASLFTPTGGGVATFDTDEIAISESGTGSVVRVTFTNEDTKAASGYATIIGVEN